MFAKRERGSRRRERRDIYMRDWENIQYLEKPY